MATSDKVIFKMLANIYLLRKSINTNFTIILMPLSLTLHNYDKFLWYKRYVPSKYIYIYIYITPTWLKYCTVLHPLLECWNPPVSYFLSRWVTRGNWHIRTTHVNYDFLSNFWVFLSLVLSFSLFAPFS